jgi:hypothetical protein
MKIKKPQQLDVTAGAPGNYKLNQKASIFSDRRIKRNKARSTQRTNAIKESFENGKNR